VQVGFASVAVPRTDQARYACNDPWANKGNGIGRIIEECREIRAARQFPPSMMDTTGPQARPLNTRTPRLILFLALAAGCCVRVSIAQEKALPNGLYAIFDTSEGIFKARLYEKETPKAVNTFVGVATGTQPTLDPATRKAVRRRLYDGIVFHRVVRGEMIQAGDPTGTGKHPCGLTNPDEILPGLRFSVAGKLAVANTGQPNTGGCQFFITVNAMGSWNGQYTIFGYIVEGLEVVNRINRKPGRGDQPRDPVKLNRVTIERVGPMPVLKKSR
jgi:peptidyl-prolyl cis-trans isomerase A (cyclophilin A)